MIQSAYFYIHFFSRNYFPYLPRWYGLLFHQSMTTDFYQNEELCSFLESTPNNVFCFIALLKTGNYMEGSKKWNLFSLPNSKTFYLGQTLIFAPWLRIRISNFTLSCSEVALQAGGLQRTTSGIIIKILLKVTMVTACWGFAAALASPNQLPCEMQIQTVWKLVKKNRGWGCRYVKYSCASWKKEDSMNDTTKKGPWHSCYHFALLFTPYCISRTIVLKLVLWNAIFIFHTQNSN